MLLQYFDVKMVENHAQGFRPNPCFSVEFFCLIVEVLRAADNRILSTRDTRDVSNAIPILGVQSLLGRLIHYGGIQGSGLWTPSCDKKAPRVKEVDQRIDQIKPQRLWKRLIELKHPVAHYPSDKLPFRSVIELLHYMNSDSSDASHVD